MKTPARPFVLPILALAAVALCGATTLAASAGAAAHPAVMRPDSATLAEWVSAYELAPWTVADGGTETPAGSLSLLTDVPYVPAERDQGTCANSWVWAATGVAEIAHAVQTGTRELFSVGFLGSDSPDANPCDGGSLSRFADWYTRTGYFVALPSTAGTSSTAVSADLDDRRYVGAVEAETIPTAGIGGAAAIANVKSVLDQHRGVYLTLWLPDAAAWKAFDDFWYGQPETAVWNPEASCGQSWKDGQGGGQAVLVVGYDDTAENPAEHYWLVLNSWGTADGNRPDGLFRLSMHTDYDCTVEDASGAWPALQFQTLSVPDGPTTCYSFTYAASPAFSGNIAVGTPTNCTGGYLPDTAISLTATPKTGAVFTGWSGSGGTFSSTSSPTTTFTISGKASVTANFAVLPNTRPYLGPGWPDKLVVSKTPGTSTDDSPLSPSDSLYLDWAAINDGAADITVKCYVDLYIDNVLKFRAWIEPTWAKGQYVYYLDYPLGSLPAGIHTLRFVTDSTNAVTEFNENDNEYTRTIVVGEPNSYLLWTSDGAAQLWTLGAGGSFVGAQGFGVSPGWQANSYQRNVDGSGQLLWANASAGQAMIWTLTPAGAFAGMMGLGVDPGWEATSYQRNADGSALLLWANASTGQAMAWTLTAAGGFGGMQGFGVEPGWKATSYYRNPDGSALLLWAKVSTGQAMMWTLTPAGAFGGMQGFGTSTGWEATSYYRNGDASAQLLWADAGSGVAQLWTITAADTFGGMQGFGVAPGWTATSFWK